MTAAWHLGPITGWELWRVLVTSPEILVFLFFMITDPRTIPATPRGPARVRGRGRVPRRAADRAVDERVLGQGRRARRARDRLRRAARSSRCSWRERALARAASGRAPAAIRAARRRRPAAVRRARRSPGMPARPAAAVAAPLDAATSPVVTIVATQGLAPIDRATGRRIAGDLVADLGHAARGAAHARPGAREPGRDRCLARASSGARIDSLARRDGRRHRVPGRARPAAARRRATARARRSSSRRSPGTSQTTTYGRRPGRRRPAERRRGRPSRTFELVAHGEPLPRQRRPRRAAPASRQRRAGAAGVVPPHRRRRERRPRLPAPGVPLRRHGRRDGDDGRRRLLARLRRRRLARPLPRQRLRRDGHRRLAAARRACRTSRLYRNVGGRFEDVTASTGAGLRVRGSGCVAADLDGNGTTDLFVTTAGYDAGRDAYDALLWNNGDGTFTEGAWKAGIRTHGWHTGAAVADVERRRATWTSSSRATRTRTTRSPARRRGSRRTTRPCRDLLYLNVGGRGAHPAFREVGRAAGLEPRRARPRPRRLVPRRRPRRPARPLRRERPRPEPAVPERRARGRARLPVRRASVGPSGSTTRTPGWGSQSATTRATGSTTSS